MNTAMEPFEIAIADEAIADLRERLRSTRWPREIGDNGGWEAGTNLGFMRELAQYWLDHYDWRRHEREMNRLPQFKTVIGGLPIHFIHVKGKGPSPTPLIATHGWPWTFWDLRKIIGPLTDPGAHGGDPADAFDVVVPSLPGFAFSSPLEAPGIFHAPTADLWAQLMTRLGYDRFAAQGADIGAFVSAMLGHRYPDRVIGVHLQHLVPIRPPLAQEEDYAPHEKGGIGKRARFMADGSGYMHIQRTRPQTIAYAMHDSPVGLAAWLIEKRRDWADTGGDVESVFDKDDLLTTVSLYWFTETYLSSAHHYYASGRANLADSLLHDRLPAVDVPVAALQFEGDMIYHPRTWAERQYNIQRWAVEKHGGHFGAAERPDVLVEDLRGFFRDLA